MCFCIPVYLGTCLCVFGHVSRINNSEPSSLSDLGTLKVMTRNLFFRKSILQKPHNFLAKGKIISPCSSVSFEKGGRKRYIKNTKNREFKKQLTKSHWTYGTGPSIHCELLHMHSSNAHHCIMSTSSDSQVFTEKHFDILSKYLLQLLGKSWTG